MKKAVRAVVYDESLQVECCHFEGMAQPFPNHFHEHYVIGLVEEGERYLSCRNRYYTIGRGSVVLFNPGDSHACKQTDSRTLHYRGMYISQEVMLDLAEKVTGKRVLPAFSENVISDETAICYLRPLHKMVMHGNSEVERGKDLLLLLLNLILHGSKPLGKADVREGVKKACRFMAQHFTECLSLEQISCEAGLSRSTLLRAFAKAKGMTPYRYLKNIRINEARRLLSEGASPLEAAIMTGFSDQSHFTNCFASFTGFTPGVYRKVFSGKDKAGK